MLLLSGVVAVRTVESETDLVLTHSVVEAVGTGGSEAGLVLINLDVVEVRTGGSDADLVFIHSASAALVEDKHVMLKYSGLLDVRSDDKQ